MYHRMSDHRITDQRSWNRLPQENVLLKCENVSYANRGAGVTEINTRPRQQLRTYALIETHG